MPDISGKKSSSGLVTPEASLRDGEFFAVKDVSFELRRGECLGLIGHNGAGKTTLLKMLNGLIKPDAGSITMRGRVGALIALGAGFNPILTGREPKGWEARRTSNRRLAQRVQRRREGANQNIYINGSVLGLTKKEPVRRRCAEEGCRRQARRASRVGRTANQIDAKIDEIIDFAQDSFVGPDAESPSTGKIKCSKGIEHF